MTETLIRLFLLFMYAAISICIIPFKFIYIKLILNQFIKSYNFIIEDLYGKQIIINLQMCMLELLNTVN
jgi:hypothetical protein